MPIPSRHLTDLAIQEKDIEEVDNAAAAMYPGFRDSVFDSRWLSDSDGIPVYECRILRQTGELRGVCRVWRWPEAGSIVFMVVSMRQEKDAIELLDQLASKMEVTGDMPAPLDMLSPEIHVDVPNDWLLSTDFKKRYWSSPTGTAFFMASHPFPAPGAELFHRYSTAPDWAGMAIGVMETLSGHPNEIEQSELEFHDRLWCIISKATGTVEYSNGTFQVTMWRWVDPRTKRFHRVYFGGLTDADIAQAQTIADSYMIVPRTSD